MNIFFIYIISLALISCSSPAKTSDVTLHVSSQKIKPTDNNILTYYYKIYPGGLWADVKAYYENGQAVEVIHYKKDIPNGYLEVTGHMEGYYRFVLFRGSDKDFVIEERTGCGPHCSQNLSVYVFKNGELIKKAEKFDSFYNLKNAEDHIYNMQMKLSTEAAPLEPWIELPRIGTAIELVLQEINYENTSDQKVYKIGSLDWNNGSFTFRPKFPNRPHGSP